MANYKHHLFKLYKNNRIAFQEYNNYKNNLCRVIRKSKRDYFINKFNSCKNDIKGSWKIINSILSKKFKKSDNITILDSRGREIHDSNVIANDFCNYFSTIAHRLDSDIPVTNTDPMGYMPDPIPASFTPALATEHEVETIIKSVPNKSVNINIMPIFIYKKIAPLISPVICDIFNSSVNEGMFPSNLKLSRTRPLFKSKNTKVKDNYRPISLLPFLSKINEKLMKTRAIEFLNENEILYNKQFGFRAGCSTSDAVLHYVDDCVAALDKRLYTVTVFLDFSKAFDTVNHDIMLRKLDRLGFRGNTNDYFRSYLCDRRMYVSVNGCDSETTTMNIGLPQGSVSAPWLFSLYINDMHRTSRKLKFIHYADDTTVYMSGNNLKRLCEEVCEELRLIDDWLKSNRLSLNINKTYCMIHTHSNYDLNDRDVRIRNTPITFVKSAKFLGITIDDRLNYNEHVTQLTKRLSRCKGILYKLSYSIPPTILRQLYFAIFYSVMIYGIAIWGGGNITNLNMVSRINRTAVNTFINELPFSIPQPLTFNLVYQYFCLLAFYRYANCENFPYFHNKIINLIPVHGHSTRFSSSNNYSLPTVSKTVSQNQFLFNAIKMWNNLPPEIKELSSITLFKSKLKQALRVQLIR